MLSHSINLYKTLQKRYSRKINLDLRRVQKALTLLNFPQLELNQPINILGTTYPLSNFLLGLSNYLVKKNEGYKLSNSDYQNTIE